MQEIIHLINEMSPYLLLGFLLAGLMHAFIPGHFYTKYLAGNSFSSVLYATLFGIPLPLCSCGVIPTAMSLRKEGASKGAVSAFLIATPQTGVDSIIATFSLMGLPFAIIRPIAALVTALFGGELVNLFSKKETASREENNHHHKPGEATVAKKSIFSSLRSALEYAYIEMMEDIGKWLVIGLIVAGLITVFVPDEVFNYFDGNTFASMFLVLVIAMPMYLCATGSIPIAVALMMKGLTPGAGLVLLMAGPACNFASMLVIDRVMGRRTLLVYMASIILGAVGFGCLIDYLQFGGIVDFLRNLAYQKECCAEGDSWFSWLCTGLLCLMLINAIVLPKLGLRKGHVHCHCHEGEECSCSHHHHHEHHHHYHHHHHHEESSCHEDECHEHECQEEENAATYIVEGMHCNHCREAAENALADCKGVESVSVDLATRKAVVVGEANYDELSSAIESIGFHLRKDEE